MSGRLPLFDNAALRSAETRAATRLGDDFVLMQRAGLAAWHCVLAHWPQAQRIVVACGPGNNGGDGYVLARHAREAGRDVRVTRLAAHAPHGPLAERACREYLDAGGTVESFDGGIGDADLVVDAIFGIGLSRAPDEDVAALIDAIAASRLPVFSLDVPSGVDADRGSAPGAAVVATHTLQFIAPHPGLCTGAARDHAGVLAVASLGVPVAVASTMPVAAWRLDARDLARAFAPRLRNAHKGDSGHVLCIGGDAGKGGAAMLCAEAALRCGAGLVSVATQPAHVAAMLSRRPEAMAHGVPAAAQLEPLLDAASVVALGPGLGQGAWGAAMFETALACDVPLVLDADALNLLARGARTLPAGTVLTPHPGEAARLLGISGAEVQANRFAAVRLLCETDRK